VTIASACHERCQTLADEGKQVGRIHAQDDDSWTWLRAVMPRACQNRRRTAVTSGHPRTPRTASDLGTGTLTRCVKRPS